MKLAKLEHAAEIKSAAWRIKAETHNNMNQIMLDWQNYIDNLVFGISEQEVSLLKYIVDHYPVNSALDVACGDGIAAIMLAEWGISVTALDCDPDRIRNNRCKSKSAGVQLNFGCADLRDLSKNCKQKCDLALCLKDSLSRLMTEADIWGTLVQIYLALEPGGLIVLHTFDYDRLFSTNDFAMKAINDSCLGKKAKISFQHRTEKTGSRFIIESPAGSIYREEEPGNKSYIPVRPIYKKELDIWLAELGFKKVQALEETAETNLAGKAWKRVTVAVRPKSAAH